MVTILGILVISIIVYIFFYTQEDIKNKFSILGSFGHFLGAIATVVGAIAAYRAVDEWKNRKRNVAIKLLTESLEIIKSIMEVMSRSGLYEYEGYYPSLVPELYSKKK